VVRNQIDAQKKLDAKILQQVKEEAIAASV